MTAGGRTGGVDGNSSAAPLVAAELLQHQQAALRSRFGAVRVGLAHGGYCLGCCFAGLALLVVPAALPVIS